MGEFPHFLFAKYNPFGGAEQTGELAAVAHEHAAHTCTNHKNSLSISVPLAPINLSILYSHVSLRWDFKTNPSLLQLHTNMYIISSSSLIILPLPKRSCEEKQLNFPSHLLGLLVPGEVMN